MLNSQLLLIIAAMFGTMVTLMSNHWLMAWVGLELNTLAFIPLITMKQHPRAIEAAIKYLLTQATASTIILFSTFLHAAAQGTWTLSPLQPALAIPITLSLAMKLGLAPLHFWYTEVLQGIPLPLGLMLSTWQKIAPMALMAQISPSINSTLLTSLAVLSVLVGGWGGINQTQLRKILAFSSIAHMGWMTVILKLNIYLTIFALIMYLLLSTTLFLNIINLNMTALTQFSTTWSKSPALTITTLFIILSTAGMPPLTGFSPKLLIALELTKASPLLVAILFLLSLIPMYFYIRLTYITALTIPPLLSHHKTTWRLTQNTFPVLSPLNILATTLLPLTPTISVMFL